MTTEEGNKIIAEFMGDDITDEAYVLFGPDSYDIEWRSIMPVVEKIENTADGYKFQLCRKRAQIIEDHGSQLHVCTKKADSKIESAWQAAVYFIQWYNSNKKTT